MTSQSHASGTASAGWKRARTLISRVGSLVREEREILRLKVELTDPENRLRGGERQERDFRVLPFDGETLSRLVEAAQHHDPLRAESIIQRYREGTRGFVAEYRGQLVGYVFFVEGSAETGHTPHKDLRWLRLLPQPGEVYLFDYVLFAPGRGKSNLFARHVQEALFLLDIKAAYGWVHKSNIPALWLYRTTGCREIGRFADVRLGRKFVIAHDTLYWIDGRSCIALIEGLQARMQAQRKFLESVFQAV